MGVKENLKAVIASALLKVSAFTSEKITWMWEIWGITTSDKVIKKMCALLLNKATHSLYISNDSPTNQDYTCPKILKREWNPTLV